MSLLTVTVKSALLCLHLQEKTKRALDCWIPIKLLPVILFAIIISTMSDG